jgi:CRP-like cAMP-binding protein
MEVLRKVPLFSGLSETDLSAFADLTRERSYPKGSVIVFEDDPGDALFLVAAGQVKVVLIAEDGREVILSVLGEGSFFGEMAVIDEEPRSAHVIAMEDSSLLVLRREDFHARLRNSPEVAISLLKEISRRLRRADEKIGSLVLLDVNGRVAHLLLRMADDEGGRPHHPQAHPPHHRADDRLQPGDGVAHDAQPGGARHHPGVAQGHHSQGSPLAHARRAARVRAVTPTG